MTKVRDPLTVADAVTEIAKVLGWETAAGVVGLTVRTVAYWSDPDDGREPSLKQALALDAAYRAETQSDHAPIRAAYDYQLDLLQAPVGNAAELRQLVGEVAREAGEAVCALLAASETNADLRTTKAAERELDEMVEVAVRTRAALGPRLKVVGG